MNFLAQRGLRKTSERFYILDQVLASTSYFEVEELCNKVNDGPYRVSRATIYNTINLLTECGIVRKCLHEGTRTRYELSNSQVIHIQQICSQCGRAKDIKDAELSRQIINRRYTAFHPEGFTLIAYGICSKCMRQNNKNKQST
jgi:Fur family ferric uptake transcriptional regulator